MPDAGALARTGFWCAKQGRLTRAALALGAGLITATGQAPLDLYPLSVAGLLGALILLGGGQSARAAGWTGWFFGLGYFALALSWIVEPFLVDIARYGWMAPFALIGMSGGMALFWAGGFWAAWRLSRGRAGILWLAWPAAMTAAELLRAYVLTGFPWAMISYVWVETPLRQLAAVTGSHGLTFLTLIAVSAIWRIAQGRAGALALLALPLPFAAMGLAGWLLIAPPPPSEGPRPVVRVIQPNAPQRQKWDPAWIPVFFQRALDLTAGPAAQKPALVIWPETSVPMLLRDAQGAFAAMQAASSGVPVVAGIRRVDQGRIYNSLAVIEGGAGGIRASQIYDKYHLVPFGEYIPFGAFFSRFGIRGLAAEDGAGFSPGKGPQILDLGAAGKALPLICYEAIFPQDVGAAPSRPQWLVQITNDAWFGEINGPYQHLAQARMRAVEQGLPMVRAANTGVSAMIDAYGRVTASLTLGEAGALDAPLPPPRPATLYSRSGDWPAALIILAMLAGLWFNLRRKSD